MFSLPLSSKIFTLIITCWKKKAFCWFYLLRDKLFYSRCVFCFQFLLLLACSIGSLFGSVKHLESVFLKVLHYYSLYLSSSPPTLCHSRGIFIYRCSLSELPKAEKKNKKSKKQKKVWRKKFWPCVKMIYQKKISQLVKYGSCQFLYAKVKTFKIKAQRSVDNNG